MPIKKKHPYSNLALLLGLDEPRPLTARELEEIEQYEKIEILRKIRAEYKWEWNAGARYLYEELIRAYGIDGEHREMLIKAAKPKAGRKHSVETAARISDLKQGGKTAKQIAKQLGISVEAVESYSKRRREPSIEEQARAAVKRAMLRRVKSPGDCSR